MAYTKKSKQSLYLGIQETPCYSDRGSGAGDFNSDSLPDYQEATKICKRKRHRNPVR